MAEYRPVDRPAQNGTDEMPNDLTMTVNDKDISKLKDNEFDLVEDRTGIFTGMDEQIVGMEDGQTKATHDHDPRRLRQGRPGGPDGQLHRHYQQDLHQAFA